MSGRGFVEVQGVIVGLLPGAVFRVELANGHRLVGRVGRKGQTEAAGLAVGDRVRVEMSPADFSTGRVMLPKRLG